MHDDNKNSRGQLCFHDEPQIDSETKDVVFTAHTDFHIIPCRITWEALFAKAGQYNGSEQDILKLFREFEASIKWHAQQIFDRGEYAPRIEGIGTGEVASGCNNMMDRTNTKQSDAGMRQGNPERPPATKEDPGGSSGVEKEAPHPEWRPPVSDAAV